MNVKLFPLNGRCLIERVPVEDRTDSGLFIPDIALERSAEAIVRCVPEGSELQPGDRVLVGHWHGSEVTLEGRDFVLIPEKKILAVMED